VLDASEIDTVGLNSALVPGAFTGFKFFDNVTVIVEILTGAVIDIKCNTVGS